ncbi:hypothetical protein GO730_01970 [Spirosoma sp. HMF3257]|uniref:Uncharacterized protein n=1 Tax=Spirosoma telluris TaxID=2183553 RepID=A0A327NED3_9BACT|nr:hypothetical protein [Spirosoma telluris]RAI73492.1 hypothetical protein HMF3257_01935 [Spirosoma telluris]
MQLFLNRQQRASCPYALLPVEQLSDEQLLIRRTKNRQMMAIVVMLMLLVVIMSVISEQFFLASTSAAMIPALDEYEKKGKAFTNELRKRNLR